MIAAVVRTYTPAGSHTRSYYQVELIRPDGSIRVLTHLKANASEVSWVNQNELAFVVGNSLELLNVITMRTTKISIKRFPTGLSLDEDFAIIGQTPLYTDDHTNFRVEGQRLAPVGETDNSFHLQLSAPKGDWSVSIQPDGSKFALTVGAVSTPIPDDAPNTFVTTFEADSKPYFVGANFNSTFGEILTVFSVDIANHKVHSVTYGHRFALAEKNRQWLYVTLRDTSDYGPNRTVWTSSLMEYNVETGKKQTLISGLKSVQSFALRP